MILFTLLSISLIVLAIRDAWHGRFRGIYLLSGWLIFTVVMYVNGIDNGIME